MRDGSVGPGPIGGRSEQGLIRDPSGEPIRGRCLGADPRGPALASVCAVGPMRGSIPGLGADPRPPLGGGGRGADLAPIRRPTCPIRWDLGGRLLSIRGSTQCHAPEATRDTVKTMDAVAMEPTMDRKCAVALDRAVHREHVDFAKMHPQHGARDQGARRAQCPG